MNSAPTPRPSSSRGRRAISLRTWCSANATTSPHLGSSCPVRGDALQNDEEQHSRARTFPGSLPRSDRGRHEVSSASVGCGAFPTSTSSLSTTRMCAEQTVVVRGRTRPRWMWLYWHNVSRARWFLTRRLRGAGLELEWAGTANTVRARRGEPTVRIVGLPSELLLYLFGRQGSAQVELIGPADAVEAVGRTRFGM